EKLDEEKCEIQAAISSSPQSAKADAGNPAAGGKSAPPSSTIEEEVGDLLFAAVNVARFVGVDPEIALKKANRKFAKRFRSMEAAAIRKGTPFAELAREEMEALW